MSESLTYSPRKFFRADQEKLWGNIDFNIIFKKKKKKKREKEREREREGKCSLLKYHDADSGEKKVFIVSPINKYASNKRFIKKLMLL